MLAVNWSQETNASRARAGREEDGIERRDMVERLLCEAFLVKLGGGRLRQSSEDHWRSRHDVMDLLCRAPAEEEKWQTSRPCLC
jgi:hypothetical protein